MSAEDARMDCIQHRRIICGKILKMMPEGVVVDSGYTNLLGLPLKHSWLVPGTTKSEPAVNLVESDQPDCVCVGLVFLTDLPKKPVPKVFDYVVITGYPEGEFTYASVGDVRRTVRKFTNKLAKSTQWKLEQSNTRDQRPALPK